MRCFLPLLVGIVACTPPEYRPDGPSMGQDPDGTTGTSAGDQDPSDGPDETETGGDDETDGDTELSDFDLCFQDIAGPEPGPDYEQFGPTVGSHCSGTDHQDITGIERVVFLGDSVTVGTLPTLANDFYRTKLAHGIANRFGLNHPGALWESVNPLDGVTMVQESGDFASCAEWGARSDDLMRDGSQIDDCFPQNKRHLNTLVIITVGGNDLQNLTEGFNEGRPVADIWVEAEEAMQLYREAIEELTTPGMFPNGISVIATNLYEYTDGTGDVRSCAGAALAGMQNVEDPALEEMVIWSMEEYMSVAVDTGTDMLFLLENFCGHGYNRDDPNGRCYRGPDAELWFDLTCIHPNPTGHQVIADMFTDVILE